jgi:hypothetical protein
MNFNWQSRLKNISDGVTEALTVASQIPAQIELKKRAQNVKDFRESVKTEILQDMGNDWTPEQAKGFAAQVDLMDDPRSIAIVGANYKAQRDLLNREGDTLKKMGVRIVPDPNTTIDSFANIVEATKKSATEKNVTKATGELSGSVPVSGADSSVGIATQGANGSEVSAFSTMADTGNNPFFGTEQRSIPAYPEGAKASDVAAVENKYAIPPGTMKQSYATADRNETSSQLQTIGDAPDRNTAYATMNKQGIVPTETTSKIVKELPTLHEVKKEKLELDKLELELQKLKTETPKERQKTFDTNIKWINGQEKSLYKALEDAVKENSNVKTGGTKNPAAASPYVSMSSSTDPGSVVSGGSKEGMTHKNWIGSDQGPTPAKGDPIADNINRLKIELGKIKKQKQYLLDNPTATLSELMQYGNSPDAGFKKGSLFGASTESGAAAPAASLNDPDADLVNNFLSDPTDKAGWKYLPEEIKKKVREKYAQSRMPTPPATQSQSQQGLDSAIMNMPQ